MTVEETTFCGGNMEITVKRQKRGELEAIRGLAALSVIGGHFFGCFAAVTDLHGVFGKLFYTSTNGSAAVVVFFVLSGVVLPLSFFRSGGETNIIAVAALNRFPRLALLVFLTVIGSYVVTKIGWNFAREASAISGVEWLGTYGYPASNEHFQPTFAEAFWQATFGTIFQNRSEFNVSLWTMYHELYGSFVTFALAMVFFKAPMRVVAVISVLSVVALQFTAWRLVPFVAGTALSIFFYRNQKFTLKPSLSLCFIAAGIVLYGFKPSNAQYWPTSFIPWGTDDQKAWLIFTLAGMLIIVGVVGNERVRQAMNAKWLVAVGRYSFAMYAVHMLLISSIASLVYVSVAPFGTVAALIVTTLVFAVAMTIASYALTRLDEWWTKRTQFAARRVMGLQRHAISGADENRTVSAGKIPA